MRTAAELDGVATRFEHPNHVAILVAEERDRAELLCGLHRRLEVTTRTVVENLRVDQIFDGRHLLRGHPLVVAEIEPKPIGANVGALLFDMVAKDFA